MTDVDELEPPAETDDDEEIAAGEELPEEEEEGREPGSSNGVPGGGRTAPILDALKELGPASAREIAQRLNREAGNVSTQLRAYEERGKVRRTGRSTQEPGNRGGPSIEWELMPDGGTRTSPADGSRVEAPPASAEGRIRALSERVGRLAAELEAAQGERDAAKAGAADARRDAQEARERASRDAAARAALTREKAALEQQRSDLEREVERLTTEIEAAEEDAGNVDGAYAERNVVQSELDDLAELLGLPNADDHGAVREAVSGLIRAGVEGARERAAASLDAPVTLPPPPLLAVHRELEMRERLFAALLEHVERGTANEDVLDRLERLAGLGHGDVDEAVQLALEGLERGRP
jgi:DNA repair exonuclease SbcCD ATPase subunit